MNNLKNYNSCYELVDFSVTSRVCLTNTRSSCVNIIKAYPIFHQINSPQKRNTPLKTPNFSRCIGTSLNFSLSASLVVGEFSRKFSGIFRKNSEMLFFRKTYNPSVPDPRLVGRSLPSKSCACGRLCQLGITCSI